ncbi:MAG: hypothetical protein HOH43_26345 [Candidatus Latescibacteria bacterium]|jgi:GNAT superfamily N-acetyltransferase|nr:hypothetical protein [Candidatus Latescibacterota bacterium]
MKIHYWEPEDSSALVGFYNDEFLQIPYYYPVSDSEFIYGIRFQEEEDLSYPDLSDVKVIVAEEQGQIVGFSHVAIWTREHDSQLGGAWRIEDRMHDRMGLVLFFHYRRGHRAGGTALMEATEQYCKGFGVSQIRIFSHYGYRFHRYSHPFGSDRMPHVLSLLGLHKYRAILGWSYTVIPDFAASEPADTLPAISYETELHSGRGDLPNIEITVKRHDEKIASTLVWSAGHTCRAGEAQSMFKIMWFYVSDEANRGQRLGSFMIQRLLWEAKKAGYQHASTGAATGNHRANLLYYNTGFETVDTNYTYFKDFDDPVTGYALDDDPHPNSGALLYT